MKNTIKLLVLIAALSVFSFAATAPSAKPLQATQCCDNLCREFVGQEHIDCIKYCEDSIKLGFPPAECGGN